MDGYDVLEKLGSGSFGTIRRIVRKSDKKVLVWKEIRYGRMSEKEKSMLVSEVNILRELKHPNIVRYKDRIIDRETSTIYIIMEFCENGDLSSVIRKYKRSGKRMEESRIWSLFFQLSCALHECHSRKQKILHRDIKPANVFIDKHQLFKLGDFGLARILSTDTQLAKTNVGTPYYMAPEQVNELPYNEKCDIWSMGCLLYEMAALAPPFEAANQLALAVKIKAGRVARIPEGYSDELNHAIRSMLQLESGKRPSIEELFKLPRMQEQAELAVKGAQAVPPTYMDRYFGQQLRRLQAKEDEIAARAQELVTKEKGLRVAKGGADEDEANKKQAEELKLKEDELRRRQERLEADAKARVASLEAEMRASLEAREASLKAREDEVGARERAAMDKERKLDKAKAEYNMLYADLKKRKKALDDQIVALPVGVEASELEEMAAAVGAGASEPRPPAPAAKGGWPESDTGGSATARVAPAEAFVRRHSCPGGTGSPRRMTGPPEGGGACKDSLDDGAIAARTKQVRPPLQDQALGSAAVRAEVKANNALSLCSEPRSPTPHPRHGLFVDRDGQERNLLPLDHDAKGPVRRSAGSGALAVLSEAATDKENSDPQQQARRQSRDAACKRQAIYGVLFGNRPTAAALDKAVAKDKEHARQLSSALESDDDDSDMGPIRLNGRRMFAPGARDGVMMPADGAAGSDSP